MVGTLKPRWSFMLPKSAEPLQREMDQVFEHFFGNGGPAAAAYYAPASLWEEENCWKVEVDLPGVKQEDVDLTVEKNSLRITAERKGPSDERKFWHQERAYGRIDRLITLPETVDAEGITAELKDGVLALTLNKRPESQPRKIQVKAN
jgi:HSP20 family protein